MEDTANQILEWFSNNIVFVVAALSLFVEIVPVKWCPISSLMKWLGKTLTADIRADIGTLQQAMSNDNDEITKRLDEQEKSIDMSRIGSIRTLVLDFANSCRNGQKHSKQQFNHVMSENGEYVKLIDKYKLQNDVYKLDYEFIQHCYKDCMDNNSFLA